MKFERTRFIECVHTSAFPVLSAGCGIHLTLIATIEEFEGSKSLGSVSFASLTLEAIAASSGAKTKSPSDSSSVKVGDGARGGATYNT